MATIDEIRENIDNYNDADLRNLLNDDREGVRDLAQKEIDSRGQPENFDPSDDPRKDPGPERYEDQFAYGAETPLDDGETRDPEESRRDETTVLSDDRFDLGGNRIK